MNIKNLNFFLLLLLFRITTTPVSGQFPEYLTNPFQFTIPDTVHGQSFFTVDLNGDNLLDYTFRTKTTLYAYNHYGSFMWSTPLAYPGLGINNHGTKHGAADIDGDGSVEIVAIDTSKIYIFNGYNGLLKKTISVSRRSTQILGHVIIVNLQGNGDHDAIVQTIDRHPEGDYRYYMNRTLIAFDLETDQELWRIEQDDDLHTKLYPVYGTFYEGYCGCAHNAPLCADIDLDGRDEVVGASVVEADGTVIDPGYYDIMRKWIGSVYREYNDHIDAIAVGNFRQDLSGLEWVICEEDNVGGQPLEKQWNTVMFSGNKLVWRKETRLFRDGADREPQNVAPGNFDLERDNCEIWNRSRFNYNTTHYEGRGQHPWVFNGYGTQISHYGTETVLPANFNDPAYGGNANGLEIIWTIDWDGSSKDYIAGQSRHNNNNVGIFDALTGDSIWTTLTRDPFIQSYFIYVADVAGDSREELISCDISGTNPLIKIFSNDKPNPYKEISKWEDPLYKRLKQNWNYYSPGSYTGYPKYEITITTQPEGFEIMVDGESYTSPHIFKWFGNSTHPVAISTVQNESNGERFVFSSWSNEQNSSHTYTVVATDTLTALMTKQYELNINSNQGNPQGADWYDENTTAAFSVSTPVTLGTTKYIFQNWSGNFYGTNPSASIVMNSPKTIIANWQTQHYLTVSSSHGNPQGEGWYNKGSFATFSLSTPEVVESTKYIFQNWSEDYSGTSAMGSIVMDTSKTVEAVWKTQYFLYTGFSPAASGYITPSPPGQWVDAESIINVSATAYSNYEFIWWSGDYTGNANPLNLFMDRSKTIQANFGKKFQITINTDPPGLKFYADETLYTAPHTFTWAEKLSHELQPQSPQSAGENTRYIFSSWSDGAEETRDYEVPGSNDNLTITFSQQYYLSLNTTHGDPQGYGWYDENQTASFSVTTPDVKGTTRYLFQNWGGDYSGTTPSGSVVMNSPKTITASWNTQYYLDIDSPRGNPQGEGWYDVSTVASFSLSSPVEEDSTKYIFKNWSGDYSGTATSGSVVMDAAKTIVALWSTYYYLSLSKEPDAGGNITPPSPGGWYEEETTLELAATAAPGYQFTGWSGDTTSQSSTLEITIWEPKSIVAQFKKEIQVTVETDPPGLDFKADDHSYTAPHTFTWLESTGHDLDTDSIQSVDNTTRYTFNTWSNQQDKNQLYTVPVSPITLIAEFFTQYYLDITSSYGNPQGEGWYNQDSTAVFQVNETHYSTDKIRFAFLSWSGDIVGNTTPVDSLIMDSPKSVTANWQPQYYLTVNNNGHGICQGEGWYDDEAEANFSISPIAIIMQGDSQYVFKGWTGEGIGSYTGENFSSSITINNPVTETANWELQYKITASTTPTWGGTVQFSTGSKWCKKGNQVTVTAIPTSGTDYEFSYWSGELSGKSNPEHLLIDSPKKICAHFIIQGTITITTDPDSIPITVDNTTYISPQQFDWISGSSHTISTPNSYHKNDYIKYFYNYWDNGGEREQVIIIGGKKIYTAFFTTQYFLSTLVDPPQGGDIIPPPPGKWYNENSYAKVEIEPADYYNFLNWIGGITGTLNPDSVKMTSPKTVTAIMEEMLTGVETKEEIPDCFALFQNRPNPFNPETNIKFQIPTASQVELLIYNASGQQIKTLLNGFRPKGIYNVVWDSTNNRGERVGSGIYFYILRTGSVVSMKKCILLR